MNQTLTEKIKKEITLEPKLNSWRGGKMSSYWNRGFCREKKYTNLPMPEKTVKSTQIKENAETRHVLRDTENNVYISTKDGVLEIQTVNTSTSKNTRKIIIQAIPTIGVITVALSVNEISQ